MPNTIAQNLARLVAARTAIANAIINKGGTVNEGDGFEEFPDDIASIMPSIKVYGYHIDPEESDPDACVTYLRDSVGMTPASMGSTTFDYGSWKDTFFMPKPCMMKYDGTLDYYLDPDDYSKKEDGTASDISDPTYAGNAMMQWPKIYYKYEQGTIEGEGYFYCSNRKIDDDYNCYCNIDSENNEIDYFYTAIYNGTSAINYSNALTYKVGDWAIYNNSQYKAIVEQTAPTAYSTSATYAVGDLCTYSGKRYECNTAIETAEAWTAAHWTEIPNSTTWDINNWTLITNSPVTNLRSLSGVRLAPTNGSGNTTGTTEVTRATANNTHTSNEWYIDTLSDRMLINSLLILISKSLNSQAKFGNGISGGGQTQKESYITGTLDDKGLFYGSTTSTTTAVKVFGMENWYSCVWRRTAGLLGTADNTYSYKLTYNNYDGSTATSYNSNGTGYLIAKDKNGNNIIRPANTNSAYWFNKAAYGPYGYLPITLSTTSSTTYYCDYYYNGSGFLLVGGVAGYGSYAGFSFFILNTSFAGSYWNLSAALSLKPLALA